jgi:hypothetical protein
MSDPGRRYELNLIAEPRRFAVVRRIIQAHLRHWDLAELVDAALLGVTELLGNVHLHVGPRQPCLLRMTADGDCVRLELHDPSPVLPRLLSADCDELGGRGLALIAALSKEWGAASDGGDGKVVWFSLQAGAEIDPAPVGPGAGSDAASAAAAGRQGVGSASCGVMAVSRS